MHGWRSGTGDGSRLSPLTIGGATPDRVPIAVLLSHANGARSAPEYQATICALKPDGEDGSILMLSWATHGSETLGESNGKSGGSDVTQFVVLIPTEVLPTTSPSMSQKLQTFGISVESCDGCRRPIGMGEPYRTDTRPPETMRIFCLECAGKMRRFCA